MTLTDLMSNSGLVIFAEIALALFFVAFVVVVARLFAPGRRQELEAAARLPLDDNQPAAPRPGAKP